jgi:fatty-acyl-CoA synthase
MTNESLIHSLDGLTLGRALRQAAEHHADRQCFKDGDQVYSFKQFDRAVDSVSELLLSAGIGAGDHVSGWLGNSIEWALLFFACGRVGAVMVPINTRYTAREVEYILRESDSKLLVMQTKAYDKDFVRVLTEIAPDIASQPPNAISMDCLPMLKAVITIGDSTPAFARDFRDAFGIESDLEKLKALDSSVDPTQPLIICYTSGTTGHPKGVMHNHAVIKQATRVGLALDLQPGEKILGHMPLYHVAGLYMGLVPAVMIGACFVNMRQWDPEKALDILENDRVTAFGGIPTHFVDLCNHSSIGQRDLSAMRNAWIGGSPVMRSTFESFKEKLNIKQLMSTYGMTENTISTTFNTLADPLDICCSNTAPVLGPSEIKIMNVDAAKECASGETGEIWCRGETVMMGYYKNPQATAEVLSDDGWLRTGDLGCLESNGYLKVTGRLKDMYKSGGTNVYPTEVEQILVAHPKIKLVSIVGIAHERLGEVGHAIVQCHDGQSVTIESIRSFCKNRIAQYKVPHGLTLVAEMPRTNTGKIDKAQLRQIVKTETEGEKI